MTSALIKISNRHEDGEKVVEITLPRRILTALRSMNPSSVRFNFGVKEQFEIDSAELKSAILETYKKKKRQRRKGVRC